MSRLDDLKAAQERIEAEFLVVSSELLNLEDRRDELQSDLDDITEEIEEAEAEEESDDEID